MNVFVFLFDGSTKFFWSKICVGFTGKDFQCTKAIFSVDSEILKTLKGAIMIHDCIYQFLRLFYHSRFKPQQLEMTLSQLSAPALDLILVVPLILRLLKDFSRFSNETKMRLQSKPGIIGNEPRRFFETFDLKSIRKSQNEVPFILTYLFILDGMFATA